MKGRETVPQLTRQSPLTDAGAGPVSGFTPGTEQQRCLETRDRAEMRNVMRNTRDITQQHVAADQPEELMAAILIVIRPRL